MIQILQFKSPYPKSHESPYNFGDVIAEAALSPCLFEIIGLGTLTVVSCFMSLILFCFVFVLGRPGRNYDSPFICQRPHKPQR